MRCDRLRACSEQYDEDRLGYTRAVDIWSLGVVACELAYGLPRYKDRYRTNGGAWCMKIATELQKALQIRPSDLGQFLLATMVVLDPGDRFCADDCYDLVRHLGTAETSYLYASPLALYSEEEDQATFRYALQNHDTEALPTVVYQPRSTGAATLSSFVKSGAPPPASLPSLWVVQECEESEGPTSSAIMRFADRQQGHELTQFFEDYPANSLNSIYVGQSLASQLGGNSEDWASQFLQESPQYSQARASGLQTEVTPGPVRSSIPRGEGGGWPLQRGTFTGEEGNAIRADDYEEIAGAALLLQAIGQGSGAL
ncbi:camk kinase [Fusarium denticulatum]|uniref:Camk kinase n=1 Tax=Fusarium denticulatum TaxID=48507 RepID=A0A8H5SVS2_9HYPO|nr:camk kinase [Fusarium denticulatum]